MRALTAFACFVALCVATFDANASLPKWTDYEKETIGSVLGVNAQARIDHEPDGKIIEEIEIMPLEVFDERDPVPDFFNVFHVTSRRRVIRRELLFDVGQPWNQASVDESARNLKALTQLSLVLIVPVRGSRPDRVRVVVITRDVWSLRLNWNVGYSIGTLTFLVVQPTEINLFGTHTSVGALFFLRPDTYSLGALFIDPRVAGSRIQGKLSGNVIFNRDTGRAEGSFGSYSYGQPLYSVDTKWEWNTQIVWLREITRLYIGSIPKTYDAAATPVTDAIPYTWSTDEYFGDYHLTRSFGHDEKHDVTIGADAYRGRYASEDLSRFDPAAAREYIETEVPKSDTRISPYLQLREHTSFFHRVQDVNTLGLGEDYSLGHDVILRAYPASRSVGSTRNLLGTYAAVSYTVPLGDGIARVLGSSSVEFSTPRETDELFEGGMRLVSPRFGVGRLVYDAAIANHYKDYLNQRYTLGGDSRLRGYPAGSFRGKDIAVANLEFRSLPVEVLSTQLGGVVFYDVGDAVDRFESIRARQDVGFGLRIMFPQFDRIAFRVDWGFPIASGYAPLPGFLYFTLGQAFAMPGISPPFSTLKRTDLSD